MLSRVQQQETQWRSVLERSDLHNSLAAITSRCSTVTSLHLCFHSCETADTCCFHISAVLSPQFHTGYFHSCKTADTCYFIPKLAPASHSVKQGPPTFTNETSKRCRCRLVMAQKIVSKSIRPDVIILHNIFLNYCAESKGTSYMGHSFGCTIFVSQADLHFNVEGDLLCKA